MDDRSSAFSDFANGFHHGYIKPWKAASMLMTLDQIPAIKEDRDRMIKYVSNCLEMEGFEPETCVIIADYLIDGQV